MQDKDVLTGLRDTSFVFFNANEHYLVRRNDSPRFVAALVVSVVDMPENIIWNCVSITIAATKVMLTLTKTKQFKPVLAR